MKNNKALSITFLSICFLTFGCTKKKTDTTTTGGSTTTATFIDSDDSAAGFGGGTISGGTGTCPSGMTCTGTMWDSTNHIVRLIQTGDNLGGGVTSGTFVSRVFDGSTFTTWSSFNWQTSLPFMKGLPDYSSAVQNETTSDYSSLSSSTLMTGIIGLWHLDEPAGTTGTGSVLDQSGSGFNGTPVSSPTFGASGKLSAAATFVNSSAQYIHVGNMGAFPARGTVSLWIYPNTVSNYNNPFCTDGLASSNTGIRFEENNGDFTANMGNDSGSGIQPTIISGIAAHTWYHIVMTWDTSQSLLWIYVNGSLVLNPSATHFPTQFADVNIGAGYDTTRTWDGLIDEVGIWSRALSAAEVLQLYRRGSNQIKYQVRACADSTCSTNPSWQGPDGTATTYFSEAFNNSTQTYSGSPFPLGGDVASGNKIPASLPLMLFSNFSSVTGLTTAVNPYFQYQAILSSDDTSTSCNYSSSATTWCSPELQSFKLNAL